LWIAFRGDDVFLDDATVLVESLDAIEPSPIRTLFIGTLGKRPVFVAEAQGNQADARFVPLRAALMSVSRELFGVVSLSAQRLRFERTHVFCGRCGRETVDKPATSRRRAHRVDSTSTRRARPRSSCSCMTTGACCSRTKLVDQSTKTVDCGQADKA